MNHTQIKIAIISFFFLNLATASTGKSALKEIGKNKQVLQRLAESLQTDEGSEKATGSKEIERRDGQKDKVYYSITTKEEEAERRQEEKEKVEKSLDVLRNMIIIPKRAK
jgi:hypothetical protein